MPRLHPKARLQHDDVRGRDVLLYPEGLVALNPTGAEILVLDVDMPNKDGFEVARAIRAQRLPVAVIFLTMHKDERFFNAALDLGVQGYVLKDSAVTEIIGSIKAVASGQEYVSPALTS